MAIEGDSEEPEPGGEMAWHVRTALGDALWRTEGGIPLPRGTLTGYVNELSARFDALQLGP
jgi:hypothetical protein